MNLWRNLTFFVAFPAIGLCMVNAYLGEKEHLEHFHRPEFIPYEHKQIRHKVNFLNILRSFRFYLWFRVSSNNYFKLISITLKPSSPKSENHVQARGGLAACPTSSARLGHLAALTESSSMILCNICNHPQEKIQ